MKQPVYMPHPGHFICARDCRFHLNTYVNGYIVSTVGELWFSRAVREIHAQVHDPAWLAEHQHRKGDDYDAVYFKRFGYEELGCDRKYETMVFLAQSDPSKCCPWRVADASELEMHGYNEADAAAEGHRAMVAKYARQRPTRRRRR